MSFTSFVGPWARYTCIFILTTLSVTARAHDISGDVSVTGRDYPLSQQNGNLTTLSTPLQINLLDEHSFSDTLKFHGHLKAWVDPTNKSSIEQNYIDLPEFNIQKAKGDFIIKAGMDVFNWGVTDGYNPLDIINSRVYWDPIHQTKMGTGALSFHYAGEKIEADLIYIPWARSSMLPGENSPWLPRQIYGVANFTYQTFSGPAQIIMPNNFNYSYSPQAPLDQALNNNLAARLQGHFNNLDLGVYAYQGIAPVPLITPIANLQVLQFSPTIIQASGNVKLATQDYFEQMVGASLVKSIGVWQLKAESAYISPQGIAAQYKGYETDSVVALERPWEVGTNLSLTTVLQYACINHSLSDGNDLTSFSRFFDSNWMLGGRMGWRDMDSFIFAYSNDQIYHSWLFDSTYEHRWNDQVKTLLTATLIDGPLNSPIGTYANNKNYSAQVLYSF